MSSALVDVPVEEWKALMSEEDRPLMVAYDLRDVLGRIERGVEHLGDGLALKADKIDLERLRSGIDTDLQGLGSRVGVLETDSARMNGWRAGFLVAAGLFGGLIAGLILNALQLV